MNPWQPALLMMGATRVIGSMLTKCPNCGSFDVHSSRASTRGERVLRVLGIAPRRCSACGWRGYRPRALYPAKQRSASMAGGEPFDPIAEAKRERSQARRRRRLRSHTRRRKLRTLQLAVFALMLGMGTGLLVFALSE